ncbi:MAG: FRG domain-containing protein [Ferruginibacter sp.]
MTEELIKRFIRHRNFLKKANIQLEYVEDDHSPCIYIDNPVIIAGFAGFVKKEMAGSNIYFRGESGSYKHVVPSLFRDGASPMTDTKAIQHKFRAYTELKNETKKHFHDMVSRFKNEEIDNLFQHYGIRSPVIDMVDNIYVATWFAMDGSKDGYGYIRLMNTSHADLMVSDLRTSHSSLSLRLHTQHGLIGKKKVKAWNAGNIFYDKYEVARIKFPVTKDIAGGVLFSKENIYPGILLDNTLKILKNSKWMAARIQQTEKKYHLKKGDLGSIR